MGRDAFEARGAHLFREIVAEFGVAFDDLLWHVGLDWLHIGRQKQPRPKRALLMYVMDDLRMPGIENLIDDKLRLDLRERVPVAIVVVAGVLVIKLRRISAFVWSTQRFLIPVVDDVHAVGIRRRRQQNDRVAQNLLNLGFV